MGTALAEFLIYTTLSASENDFPAEKCGLDLFSLR